MNATRCRVLVGLLVYNGRTFVPAAVASASRLQKRGQHDVDVVVFDDASPDPGWSEELQRHCASQNVGYYRSPRNLGIPRNMNLVFGHAERENYDYAILLNSDVLVAETLVDELLKAANTANAAAQHGAKVASITAWSNNASIFSIDNDDADRFLADQRSVDQTAVVLAREFASSSAVDLPVGMGYCLCVPVDAIRSIGVMDPVFGRGYCEEVDWCCRAHTAGWRHVLATGAFAYHIGSATTRLAGILQPGEQTVNVNEAIIDNRHPGYRPRVEAWEQHGGIEAVKQRASRALVRDHVASHGYVVDASWLRRAPLDPSDQRVCIRLNPDGPAALVEASANGWRASIDVGDEGILRAIASFLGCEPTEVRLLDNGTIAERLAVEAGELGLHVQQLHRYPERV